MRVGVLAKGAMFGLIFAVGVAASRTYDVNVSVVSRIPTANDTSAYFPEYRPTTGPQIELVYLGASTCAWSNTEDLPAALGEAKQHLAELADLNGMSFKAVGVALDWSVDAGIRHLSKFGRFDEVSSGYNWGNSYALRDIWNDGDPQAHTPQVVVYLRQFNVPSDTLAPAYSEAGRQRVFVVAGAKAIIEWARDGAPLPPGFAATVDIDRSLAGP